MTSFPAPLDLAPVDDDSYKDHEGAKEVIEKKPELCSSHTVLVVDTSGSMKTHDIVLHRDRQVAAYSTVALEYVAEQLFTESANNRDVVSLVEFNKIANVIFEREPISWVLFNKLLKRRDVESKFLNRQLDLLSDVFNYDSNYLPALGKPLDRWYLCPKYNSPLTLSSVLIHRRSGKTSRTRSSRRLRSIALLHIRRNSHGCRRKGYHPNGSWA